MSKKIDLGIDPFEGDFSDGEIEIKKGIVDIPKCHVCKKPFVSGKCVTKIDIKPDWDEEKIDEIEIFFWHKECWLKIQNGIE